MCKEIILAKRYETYYLANLDFLKNQLYELLHGQRDNLSQKTWNLLFCQFVFPEKPLLHIPDLISSLNYGDACHSRQSTILFMRVIMMASCSKFMHMHIWRSHVKLTLFNTNCLLLVHFSYTCHMCSIKSPVILHTPTSIYFIWDFR